MHMDTKVTKDHDEIRAWVEEHGGNPIIRDKRGDQRGVIDIAFEEPLTEEAISWLEFFDTFDSLNMEFRYECQDDQCKEYGYSFISPDDETSVKEEDDPNELPEDDVPAENLVPSAPAYPSPDAVDLHRSRG